VAFQGRAAVISGQKEEEHLVPVRMVRLQSQKGPGKNGEPCQPTTALRPMLGAFSPRLWKGGVGWGDCVKWAGEGVGGKEGD
jgi:hypothetical protein